MTKKHFEAIASTLRHQASDARNSDERTVVYDTAARLADLFEQENPRFDRTRFLVACGIATVNQ